VSNVAQLARVYTPSLLKDENVFNDRDPPSWAYHVRVKREKESMEYTGQKA
jgi:hypothetical protein